MDSVFVRVRKEGFVKRLCQSYRASARGFEVDRSAPPGIIVNAYHSAEINGE